MSSSVAGQIHDAAPRQRELLDEVLSTSYAVPALEEQKSHIATLGRKLAKLRTNIAELDRKREAELKRHKSYRDSVVKKFAFRLRGRSNEFAARAQDGQDEYYQVLRREQQAKETENRLHLERAEALAARSELEAVLAQHARARGQLDVLYDGIFGGPTPEFPEEDELEWRVGDASSAYDLAVASADADARTVDRLTDAKNLTLAALDGIREALSGGQLASMATERRCLERADQALQSAQKVVLPSRNVLSVPRVTIQLGLVRSEIYDNPFGHMAFHERIRCWRSEIETALNTLDRELDAANASYGESRRVRESTFRVFEAAKEELRMLRTGIFESMCPAASDDFLPPYQHE